MTPELCADVSTTFNSQPDDFSNFDLASIFTAYDPSMTPSFSTSSYVPDTSFNFFPGSSFDFYSSPDSTLPHLPAPPPKSPVRSSPAAEIVPAPISTRSRRSQIDGLEPSNILAPGSSRSRVPRKRGADDEVSEKSAKKRKVCVPPDASSPSP